VVNGSEDELIMAPRLAFSCLATNMVANDTNNVEDVFEMAVAPLTLGWPVSIRRISTSTDGNQALNGYSQAPSINADGRRVAFHSYSNTLVTGDTNNCPDVFVKALESGRLVRITGPGLVQPNASSLRPAFSGDGRFVAFESQASNLVAAITSRDTFRAYRTEYASNSTRLVSVDATGQPDPAGGVAVSINYDGTRVSYDVFEQVYVWQQENDATRVVAWNNSGAARANGAGVQSALAQSQAHEDVIVWSSNSSDLADTAAGNRW
jgi:hypothetical protein